MRRGRVVSLAGGSVRLELGDCLELMRCLPEQSIDSVVTDPPYDLLQASRKGSARSNEPNNPYGRHGSRGSGFMGMAWDATGIAFDPKTWEEVLRVLKPGGHLVAFGGARTFHRMTCAIEDTGFEIRDCLMWLYGSGFPKSLDVGRAMAKAAGVAGEEASRGRSHGAGSARLDAEDDLTISHQGTPAATDEATRWQGWGTALKPAWEPIILARRPLSESSVSANVQRWGTGALNIDGCRVPSADDYEAKCRSVAGLPYLAPGSCYGDPPDVRGNPFNPAGRWPANLVLSHSPTCDEMARECAADCPIADLDRQSGDGRSRIGRPRSATKPGGGYGMTHTGAEYDDQGGASRFFYVAKASTRERNHGLSAFDEKPVLWSSGTANPGSFQSPGTKRAAQNHHPCVKPLALMRRLCRLVTPPGGTVMDPFMGSGSTGLAAVLEGFSFIAFERQEEYMRIAKARITQGIRDAVAGTWKAA